DLTGKVKAGSTVTATFTVADGCLDLGLASYDAPNRDFDHNLAQQRLFGSDVSAVMGTGPNPALTVRVPPCLFQIDVFNGSVIEHFVPPDATYGAEHRLLDTAKGGTQCTPSSTTTTSTTTTS